MKPHQGVAASYAAAAFGAAIGGVLRVLASVAMHEFAGDGFPWGTLFVNVTGSFAIGFYATLAGPKGRLAAGPIQRQFVMTGICGGYTTFSMFSLETLRLLHDGNSRAAAFNVALSVIAWLAAVWLGYRAATAVNGAKA